MSGTVGPRQHFLPRFMLAGFATRVQPKKQGKTTVWTYRFRQGLPPLELTTKQIGAEHNFYVRNGDPAIDVAFQEHENDAGALVAEMRRLRSVPIEPACSPAQLVVGLFMRSRNTRLALLDITTRVKAEVLGKLEDPELRRMPLIRHLRTRPLVITDALEREQGRPPTVPEVDAAITFYENALHGAEGTKWLARQYRNFAENNPTIEGAKQVHLRVLESGILPAARLNQLAAMHWRVEIFDTGSFILGDVGPLLFDPDGCGFRGMLAFNVQPGIVMLPISDRFLLVGREAGLESTELPDTDAINTASSSFSAEFFVATQSGERELRYLTSLGSGDILLGDADLTKLAEQFVETLAAELGDRTAVNR
ncbi:MAG: DUF4238 domain-containing protein [bacterium]